MSTVLRDPPDLAGPGGGIVARRAVFRWGWRLFRREWRQQLLVLGLLTAAVPYVAQLGSGSCAFVTTLAPQIVAATATVSRPSTSNCWRHSRRNNRQPQRTTARRAGTPPFPVPTGAGRSRSAVLTEPGPA